MALEEYKDRVHGECSITLVCSHCNEFLLGDCEYDSKAMVTTFDTWQCDCGGSRITMLIERLDYYLPSTRQRLLVGGDVHD